MELTQQLKRLHRQLGLHPDFPSVTGRTVKRRVNAALNAAPLERRAYLRRRMRIAAVLAAAVITLCGTALAVYRFHFLGAYYGGDSLPLAQYIAPVDGAITDGVFTVRAEGVVTDGFTTIVGLSICAQNPADLKELMDTHPPEEILPAYYDLLSFEAQDSSTRAVSVQYRRLQQYETDNTAYLSVRIAGPSDTLYIRFRGGDPSAPVMEIPLDEPVEALELRPAPSDMQDTGYAVSRIALSAMGLQLELDFPAPRKSTDPDLILPFYFRMADGSIQTPSQFFGRGSPWHNISRIRQSGDGPCTYLFSAPAPNPVDLLSVSGIIIQDTEYTFQLPGQTAAVTVDETLVPFLTPFVEIDDRFYITAQEVCRRLGADLWIAPDEKTARLTYRGTTVTFEVGSTAIWVDGTPAQLDGGKTLLQGGVLLLSGGVLPDYFQVGANMYFSQPGDATTAPQWWLITP